MEYLSSMEILGMVYHVSVERLGWRVGFRYWDRCMISLAGFWLGRGGLGGVDSGDIAGGFGGKGKGRRGDEGREFWDGHGEGR